MVWLPLMNASLPSSPSSIQHLILWLQGQMQTKENLDQRHQGSRDDPWYSTNTGFPITCRPWTFSSQDSHDDTRGWMKENGWRINWFLQQTPTSSLHLFPLPPFPSFYTTFTPTPPPPLPPATHTPPSVPSFHSPSVCKTISQSSFLPNHSTSPEVLTWPRAKLFPSSL